MRLLQRDPRGNLNFTPDFDAKLPPYIILSHVWEIDNTQEIRYQDIEKDVKQRGRGYVGPPAYHEKLGYHKIIFCLKQAASEGIQYVWVDTCCINKESSAELNKSINSMFRWYALAVKCYVYLSDVTYKGDGSQSWPDDFRKSRWFTRGWTLQELLAPANVDFFTRDGGLLGSKLDLADTISTKTGVPCEALRGRAMSEYSVLERFNWGRSRITKEPEDRIYSLFGILGVSFAPNYGEGLRVALRHLRREIKESYGDQGLQLSFEQQEHGNNVTQDNLPPDVVQKLKDLMSFETMNHRYEAIAPKTRKTCDWLLQNPAYRAWSECMSPQQSFQNMLWIKGNPGTGKSTLLKYANAQALSASSTDALVLSFYFSARGAILDRSTVGMYRSLVHQLLTIVETNDHLVPRALGVIKSYMSISRRRTGSIGELRLLFEDLIVSLREQQVTIFIDALDECDETEVREMVSFVEDLIEAASENELKISVCFASRYYPAITICDCREIHLAAEEGHVRDLAIHVEKRLYVGTDARAKRIRLKLLEKANGVFIWAVLVIDLLNKDFREGRTSLILQRLKQLPRDLKLLYHSILDRDSTENSAIVLCMRLILYNFDRLTPEHFFQTMTTGVDDEPFSAHERHNLDIYGTLAGSDELIARTSEDLKHYVSACSKGLAEVVEHKEEFYVQFIHGSVRDYLLKHGGMATLCAQEEDSLYCAAHDQLKRAFYQDINRTSTAILRLGYKRYVRSGHSVINQDSFRNLLLHAEEASEKIRQDLFLSDLDEHRQHWSGYDKCFYSLHGDALDVSKDPLLAFLITAGAKRLIVTMRKLGHNFDIMIGTKPAMMSAMMGGDVELTQCLVDCGTPTERADVSGVTPLLTACRYPFYSIHTNLGMIKMLLDAGSNIETCDQLGKTPLMVASSVNKVEVIIMLLDRGANIHATDDIGRTALHHAILSDRGYGPSNDKQETVRILLEAGANIDAVTDCHETVFDLHGLYPRGVFKLLKEWLARARL